MSEIRRVAVLGAGTMGSRIAAHFANAGVPALLLDIVLPGEADRSAAARKGLENAARGKPPAFFSQSLRSLVTPGNFEDHLSRIGECDWILEAVVEDLALKRGLLERVARHRRPGSIVSTNTSGLPVRWLAAGLPEELRRSFLGAHFFNPPRYLHLVELVPTAETDPDVLGQVREFCDVRLGKGVVLAKDTPNFIANRIGFFLACTVNRLADAFDYSVEQVDELTGPLIGLPRTASFRLMDLIGLDVWVSIVENLHESAREDPWRERFRAPEWVRRMVERGWLGQKAQRGFYQRTGKDLLVLDWRTLEYRPARKVSMPPVEAVAGIEELPERLRALMRLEDRAGEFLWKLWSDVLLYAAGRVPEISERIVEIDRAMRWGYGHKLGPFELWDALGVRRTVRRMEREDRAIPPAVLRMLGAGAESFYRAADREGRPRSEYFDLVRGRYQGLEERPGVLCLAELKRARGAVARAAGASLVDLGEGVLGVEFHSPMNLLGEAQAEMIEAALEPAARNWRAVVITGDGERFSAGLDPAPVLTAARRQDWRGLEATLRRWQRVHLAVKYAARPVVAAAFGQTLGLACELALHAAQIQASAETSMGLDQAVAGLIPAAGGLKELLVRLGDARRVLDLILRARVSSSAEEAREFGLLKEGDGVTMNPERLIGDAKARAVRLAADYKPAPPPVEIPVAGESWRAELCEVLGAAAGRGEIGEHDLAVGEKLVWVLSGGGRPQVSEAEWLDLECEAFLSLCGNAQTQARLESLLKRGRPAPL